MLDTQSIRGSAKERGVAKDRPKERFRVRGVGVFCDRILFIAYVTRKSNTKEPKTHVPTTQVMKENISDSLKPTVALPPHSIILLS